MDYFQPRSDLMPASFKVIQEDGEEQLEANFGIVVNFTEIALAKLNVVVGICWCRKKTGRTELAKRAIKLAQHRLIPDRFPEYYDSKNG